MDKRKRTLIFSSIVCIYPVEMHDGDHVSYDMLETFLMYFLIFIYDLFYDISSSDNVVSNARVINELERM
jgi:hypothetical protein